MRQYVYNYEDAADAGRELLGGKGLGLTQMTALGVPVPAGFVVTTEACIEYMRAGGALPDGLGDEIAAHVIRLEEQTGKRLRRRERPAARLGALGRGHLDARDDGHDPEPRPQREVRRGARRRHGESALRVDAYRRLVQMYGEVVEGIDAHRFERELAKLKGERGRRATSISVRTVYVSSSAPLRGIYHDATGTDFPPDPAHPALAAIRAVFDSWNTPRAQVYRRANAIPDDLGTAANVIQMVFGNKGETSATGVAFTRNPSTGEPGAFGEFLSNAQGEDVVAGIRTPDPLERMANVLPRAHAELLQTMQRLERHFREMQDIEFTVQEDRLYLLQTRGGKRTAAAALRIAVDMVREGLISPRRRSFASIQGSSTSCSIP